MHDKKAIINSAQKFAARGQIDDAIAEWSKLVEESKDGNCPPAPQPDSGNS